jgi:hypothetical protein
MTLRESVSCFGSALPASRFPYRLPPNVVQLLPCKRPHGPLEVAPRSALCVETATEKWEGFWCLEDERYYTRCIRDGVSEQWYHLVDEPPRARIKEARVIPLRPRGGREYPVTRHMMLVTPADGSRAILIGGSRRGSRADGRASAEADR